MEEEPYLARESRRIVEVYEGGPGARIDRIAEPDVAVIVGANGYAAAGSGGLAYAGNGKDKAKAKVARYGIALVGNQGEAHGGAGCVLFAYDGGHAFGGDGSFAIARRGGNAECGQAGLASALDGTAKANGPASVALARRQNGGSVRAEVAAEGVAIARDYSLSPANRVPAQAHAGSGGIAIAFEDNHVSGEMGALLVGTYKAKDGSTRFATAVVDGEAILPGKVYEVDAKGRFVPVT